MSQRSIVFDPPSVVGRPRLLSSVSGGKTSCFMARQLQLHFSERYEIVHVFANASKENEETLEFMHNCDRHWGLNAVWVEAVVRHGERKSSGHRIVTFETASRNGEPFEEVIKKYGIPNKSFPHCTRELKLRPIDSYMAAIGWTDYMTAIGIRPDEPRRVNLLAAASRQIVYPLIDWFYADKQDVNDWWEDQPFNLRLQEHEGNCRTCWKKSFAKLTRLCRETPESFDWNELMEKRYAHIGPEQGLPGRPLRVFFRQNTSTQMLRAMAATADAPEVVDHPDESGGCSESCELYPMLDLEAA